MTDFEKEDIELRRIMESRSKNQSQASQQAAGTRKTEPAIKNTQYAENTANTSCEPVKHTPNFLKRITAIAKDAFFYALALAVVFWWQHTGRLDYATAWYSMVFCAGLISFTVGKHCTGRDR